MLLASAGFTSPPSLPPPLHARSFEVEEVHGGCRLALKRTLISELSSKER